MLIFSVSFQFQRMIPEGNPTRRSPPFSAKPKTLAWKTSRRGLRAAQPSGSQPPAPLAAFYGQFFSGLPRQDLPGADFLGRSRYFWHCHPFKVGALPKEHRGTDRKTVLSPSPHWHWPKRLVNALGWERAQEARQTQRPRSAAPVARRRTLRPVRRGAEVPILSSGQLSPALLPEGGGPKQSEAIAHAAMIPTQAAIEAKLPMSTQDISSSSRPMKTRTAPMPYWM